MALDRQRILSELGSVVNQLQSADCGCMGKLFSNPGQGPEPSQMGHPLPTCSGCRHGCCHGHGGGPSSYGAMNQPCMGRCNPPKLYADTYSYLNQNLMQPVVQDVYNELSTINPQNTITNNPIAQQMGLGSGNAMQGNMGQSNPPPESGMCQENMMKNPGMMTNPAMMTGQGNPSNTIMHGNMGAMGRSKQMMPGGGLENSSPLGNMGGMGAQIVNMMMSGGRSKPSNMSGAGGQMDPSAQASGMPMSSMGQGDPNAQDQFAMGQNNGMQWDMTKQGGNMGMMSPGGNMGMMNQGGMQDPMRMQSQGDNMGMQSHEGGKMGMQNPGGQMGMQNPTTQYVTQDNMHMLQGQDANVVKNIPNSQAIPGGYHMHPNKNPASRQMPKSQNLYGQHAAGMQKFNEMFPGVMGGDLGFDPMAIALQMNPANHKQAAMDTMQKLMNDKGVIQPGAGGNAAAAQMNQAQHNQYQQNANEVANQPMSAQHPDTMGQMQQNPQMQQVGLTSQDANQQMIQDQTSGQPMQQQQQVYSAMTGAPAMRQQQIPQQPGQGQVYQQHQQFVDPKAATGNLQAAAYENASDPNAQIQESIVPGDSLPQAQPIIMDPIFPADTTKNRSFHYSGKPQQTYYHYNTLGQPVELLPGNSYHTAPPPLPQTLSPQPVTSGKFSVKNTMSKTSIMGNKPGRTASRSQLQHLYKQFKGSQSYTQQNINAPPQTASHSEGKLNAAPRTNLQQPRANLQQLNQIPVEKVGGDTLANNQTNNQVPNKVEQVMGQIGDVPASKPQGDGVPKMPSIKMGSLRNGLQDMVYTAYSPAAWSFHGDNYVPRNSLFYNRPTLRSRNRV